MDILTPFLGLDHLRSEAELPAIGLASTWLPLALVIATLAFAAATATYAIRIDSFQWPISASKAGTAFLFGAGIYCGTFMLGTNFIYRLMFLLLCFPQLFEWSQISAKERLAPIGFLSLIMLALWTSGNANGITTFVFWPQAMHWVIFFGLITILLSQFFDWNSRNYFRPGQPVLSDDWPKPRSFRPLRQTTVEH